jgi:Uma2 family endonuclease
MHPQRAPIEGAGTRPLTRSLYHVLVDHGALEGEHVELLRGVLVEMSPQSAKHTYPLTRLTAILVPKLVGRAEVRVQMPFAANDESEPEPDFAIAPLAEYLDDHPSRAFLLVEASASSVTFDRDIKAPLYATCEVQEYWIIDVSAGTVTVYADSHDGLWRTMTTHGRESTLPIPGFPDVEVRLADILPPI